LDTASTPHLAGEVHCWELYGRRGVLKDKWKAEYMDKPYGTGSWELYDLEKDPSETQNLAAKQPEILHDLKYEWARYAKKYKVILPAEKVAYGVDDFWIEQ
jgi:arylsulfatase